MVTRLPTETVPSRFAGRLFLSALPYAARGRNVVFCRVVGRDPKKTLTLRNGPNAPNTMIMATIRLTKEFSFEAAHSLEGYDGACREIHGHSYRLFVTIKGEPSADPYDPKQGMVMDFGSLKRIVNEQIVSRLDHAFVVRRSEQGVQLRDMLADRYSNIVLVDYQPTCENMLADFAERLLESLPDEVELYSLRLHETASSFAEWFAEDNF
jgi:6-pyruvoyltetrahydropterin/6-carboxytetrahydropterin synthase